MTVVKKLKFLILKETSLKPGDIIKGQCIISEEQTTIVVSNKFNTKVLSNNFLQMEYTNDE